MQHYNLRIEFLPGGQWHTRSTGIAVIDKDPRYAIYNNSTRIMIRDGRPYEFESGYDLMRPVEVEELKSMAAQATLSKHAVEMGDAYFPQELRAGEISQTVGGVSKREQRALEILKTLMPDAHGPADPDRKKWAAYRFDVCKAAVDWADALQEALDHEE